MSYFRTQQTPLAGRADLFQANPDFQSLLDAKMFDLGTPSELTETTAAPATGPSGSLGASSLQPNNPYGIDFNDLSNENKLNFMLFDMLKGQRPTAEDDERRFRMIQQFQREDAERADAMGRRNYDKALVGSLIQKLPEAIGRMASAGTAFNAQTVVGPFNAAQYGGSQRYFT
jgi:hypothetical protein